MSGITDKSSREIEREVEESRADLQNTLHELSSKMSPGQLFDQAVGYLKTSGGNDFANNLGRSVRDNPLPVAMIGAGIAWLMLGQGQLSARTGGAERQTSLQPRRVPHPPEHVGIRPSPAYSGDDGIYAAKRSSGAWPGAAGAHAGVQEGGDAPSTGTGIADAASSVGSSVARGAADLYDDAEGTVSSAYAGARDATHDAASAIGSTAGHAVDRAQDLAQDLRHGADRMGSYAQQRWSSMVQEQPAILGGIGLAIGAALGAALPRTETEDRLMGGTGDAIKNTVAETADSYLKEAGTTASRAYREVSDTLSENSPGKERMTGAVERVADTVRDAVSTVSDHAKRHIDEAGRNTSGKAADREKAHSHPV